MHGAARDRAAAEGARGGARGGLARRCTPSASSFARPFVIRLTSYVRVPRDAHRRKITRRAVFARDDWTCQYCGARSNLTVDHVIPRSKGGPSSWENIVASCAPCNRRKGDRTPAQADMHPHRRRRARRTRRSSSACRARRSRRPGGRTCRRRRSRRPRAPARRTAPARRGPRRSARTDAPRASARRRNDGGRPRAPSASDVCWTKPHRHCRVRPATGQRAGGTRSGGLYDGGPGWIPLGGSSQLLRPNGRPPPESRKYCQPSEDHLLSLVHAE